MSSPSTTKSVFAVPKMDCPSEERMIRMVLDGTAGVHDLRFDLQARTLTVVHAGEPSPILAKLEPLGLGARLATTEETATDDAPGAAVVPKRGPQDQPCEGFPASNPSDAVALLLRATRRGIIPLRFVRRVAAILLLGAMVTTSVASASPAGCPTMRARALKHCCCPPLGSEGARLTCCVLKNDDVRTCAAFVREQTERVQIALLPVAPAFFRPSDAAVQLDIATLELVETSTDPPSVPLRV